MEKKVYTVTDIQTILGLSRTKAYDFIKNAYNSKKPFPVIKIDFFVITYPTSTTFLD